RLQAVRVAGVQREKRPPVLQRETKIARHQSGAESHVVALDQRYAVAILVHDAEINRLTPAQLGVAGFHRAQGLVQIDKLATTFGVRLGNQLSRWNLDKGRVGIET